MLPNLTTILQTNLKKVPQLTTTYAGIFIVLTIVFEPGIVLALCQVSLVTKTLYVIEYYGACALPVESIFLCVNKVWMTQLSADNLDDKEVWNRF